MDTFTGVNGTVVRDLGKIEDEAVWFGRVTVCGSDFYAYFIAVREIVRGGELLQEAVDDPFRRLDEVFAADPDAGHRQTVSLPGLDDDFVLLLVTASR